MIDVPVRVREALKSGAYLNNYRVVVLDENGDEDFTIDNNNLVEESVKLDERMCSTDTLKFGLCEGTSIEFQYFDYPNITKRKIKLYIDVSYRDKDKVLQNYAIPLGWYEIKECSRQADTGIIKASGYNKLLSDYLDQDAKLEILKLASAGENGVTGQVSVAKVIESLLGDYSIETYTTGTVVASGGGGGEISNSTLTICNADGTPTGQYLYTGYLFTGRKINGATSTDYYRITGHGEKILDWYKSNTFASFLNYYVRIPIEKGGYEVFKIEDILNNGLDERFSSATRKLLGSDFGIESANYVVYGTQTLSSRTDKTTPNVTNVVLADGFYNVRIGLSFLAKVVSSSSYTPSTADTNAINAKAQSTPFETLFSIVRVNYTTLQKFRLTTATINSLTNGVTLRSLQSSVFELAAQYGKLDRVSDLFSGVTLNGDRLLPSDTLYPENDLYPMSIADRADKAMYSKLWADEGNVHKFRNLVVTYKDSTTNQDAEITKVINADGTDDYIMSDNWLLKNLPWTSAQVNSYVDAMVNAMKNVTWFPFEMWCAGLPYIEAGDEIEIALGGKTYTSYVLTRTLSGIQNLQDTYINGTLNIF